MLNNVYAVIDIGESKSKLLISTIANKEIVVCATFVCDTYGIKNGEIISKIEFQKSISNLLTLANDEGYDIKEAVAILPSNYLGVYRKRAMQDITSPNRLVSAKDIDLLQRACARHQLSSSDTVVGIYPIKYSVAQNEIVDTGKDAPIGYKASSVTLDAYILVLPTSIAKTYIDTIETLGVSIMDAIVAPYANSYLLLDSEDHKSGAVIIDLGAYQTNVSFFKDQLLAACHKIRIGSELLSNNLAEYLNSDLKTGERVKINFGNAIASNCSEIGVYLNQSNQNLVKELDIGMVCESALDSILNEIKKNVDPSLFDRQPNVYLTGGGANLANIALKFTRVLGIKCSVRRPAIIGARDPMFSACFGAIFHYMTSNELV